MLVLIKTIAEIQMDQIQFGATLILKGDGKSVNQFSRYMGLKYAKYAKKVKKVTRSVKLTRSVKNTEDAKTKLDKDYNAKHGILKLLTLISSDQKS